MNKYIDILNNFAFSKSGICLPPVNMAGTNHVTCSLLILSCPCGKTVSGVDSNRNIRLKTVGHKGVYWTGDMIYFI